MAKTRDIKVAFITHYESLYGANRSLLGLIDGLREYDVVPFVIGREPGAISEALNVRKVPFVVLPFEWWARSRPVGKYFAGKMMSYVEWRKQTLGRLKANLDVLPEMKKQLRAWDADIVYTNSSVTPIGFMAAKQLSLPHVWHLREFCDLHFGLEYDWGRRMFEYFVGRSDAVISVSKAVEGYYLKKVADSRKHVVYNGVASREFVEKLYNKTEIRKCSQPYRFVMIGAIQPNKGHEEALQALAQVYSDYKNVRLRIVGQGDVAGLNRIVHELGLADVVEYIAYVEDPFTILLDSDALLVCSKYEAMGRVTVEAMAACKPVIGYDQGGTSEIIQHDKTGLLYRKGCVDLANAMRRFLSDPVWAASLGVNGWRIAKDNYTIEKYAENVNEILQSVIS